jgi:hypothetical protein
MNDNILTILILFCSFNHLKTEGNGIMIKIGFLQQPSVSPMDKVNWILTTFMANAANCHHHNTINDNVKGNTEIDTLELRLRLSIMDDNDDTLTRIDNEEFHHSQQEKRDDDVLCLTFGLVL